MTPSDIDVLDCRGQRCPLPVIALARRITEVPVGAVVRLLADDPAAPGDVAAWCRMRGHEFLGATAGAATGPGGQDGTTGPDTIDVRRVS